MRKNSEMNDLVIRVVRNFDDAKKVFKLRYEVFGREGYLDISDYPLGMENDDYDLLPETTLFLAEVGGKPVGTLRLVLDSPYGLSIESHIKNVDDYRMEGRKVAEGSRWALLPEYRGTLSISLGLSKIFYIYGIKEYGVTDYISHYNLGNHGGNSRSRPNVAKLVELLGYNAIGESFYHEGFNEDALPMRLEVGNLAKRFDSYVHTPNPFIEQPYHVLEHGWITNKQIDIVLNELSENIMLTGA